MCSKSFRVVEHKFVTRPKTEISANACKLSSGWLSTPIISLLGHRLVVTKSGIHLDTKSKDFIVILEPLLLFLLSFRVFTLVLNLFVIWMLLFFLWNVIFKLLYKLFDTPYLTLQLFSPSYWTFFALFIFHQRILL